jgi:gas vesicle protein
MSERFMYFFGGLSFGLAVAMLWAPKSGAETRAAIRESADQGAAFLREQTGQLHDTLQAKVDQTKAAVSDLASNTASQLSR